MKLPPLEGDVRRTVERMLDELPERNADNVTRTASYLELYALARAAGRELPWVLMAHLVSRNSGYLMSDLAVAIERGNTPFSREALTEMFLFLERPNFVIFHDAFWHVAHHLLGRPMQEGRVPRFVRRAWRRYEEAAASPEVERALVFDLVENEQNLIERRTVHAPRFERARAMTRFFDATGGERPIVLPVTRAEIVVGGFLELEKRIATGQRIFDEALADPVQREAIFEWTMARPHTGSRAAYGAKATPPIREAWPRERVRALWPDVHADPEPDPFWP
jgi:hypothetical protein